MHYIEPITDGLTIDSVGGESQYYLFQINESTIEETITYNFYHHCDNPIEITIYDDENNVLLTNATWDGDPIFIEFEEGELYKLVIETTNNEYFNIHQTVDKLSIVFFNIWKKCLKNVIIYISKFFINEVLLCSIKKATKQYI